MLIFSTLLFTTLLIYQYRSLSIVLVSCIYSYAQYRITRTQAHQHNLSFETGKKDKRKYPDNLKLKRKRKNKRKKDKRLPK